MNSVELLEKLAGFPTVSDRPNSDLVAFIKEFLASHGIQAATVPNETGTKASLFATIGPNVPGGIVISGHTDVVPVEGQAWSSDPFRLTERDGRFFARGAADMKGFVACALRAAAAASQKQLKRPLHLALSYDEEIGCVGVRPLIDVLAKTPLAPCLCLVGEPTGMRIALGHKGKIAARAVCRGVEGHSATAPMALNAIHLAADFIGRLRKLQTELEKSGKRDEAYDVPYTTIHAGKISGGVALNIVPNICTVDFEIRNVAAEDPAALFEKIREDAAAIVEPLRSRFPQAEISLEIKNSYPGLDTNLNGEVLSLVKKLAANPAPIKVSFGTEGGLYQEKLDYPTIVCGPGFMDQGHKPDEFISGEQIARCDAMMDGLIDYLSR